MTTTPTTSIARALRKRLRAAGDPVRAKAQQAYMKSAMPYAGVQMTVIRAIWNGGQVREARATWSANC